MSREKLCRRCNTVKQSTEFYVDRAKANGLQSKCKKCNKEMGVDYNQRNLEMVREKSKKYRARPEVLLRRAKLTREWNRRSRESVLLSHAKRRAKALNVSFDICVEDIVIPDKCPILNIPLIVGDGKAHAGSPTLDRIIPALGYIKGNIAVISFRANRIKCDSSLDELILLVNWLKERKYE